MLPKCGGDGDWTSYYAQPMTVAKITVEGMVTCNVPLSTNTSQTCLGGAAVTKDDQTLSIDLNSHVISCLQSSTVGTRPVQVSPT